MVQTARPSADSTDGGWVNESEGTTLYTSIDEVTADGATTHIYSTDDGSNDTCIVDLASIDAPGSGNVYIKYTALGEDNMGMGAPGIEIRLLEGGATRGAAHTDTNVASSWGTEVTSSAIDVSSVSNWGNLELKITMTTNSGSGMDYLKVTQAYLETPDAAASSTATPMALNTYQQLRND